MTIKRIKRPATSCYTHQFTPLSIHNNFIIQNYIEQKSFRKQSSLRMLSNSYCFWAPDNSDDDYDYLEVESIEVNEETKNEEDQNDKKVPNINEETKPDDTIQISKPVQKSKPVLKIDKLEISESDLNNANDQFLDKDSEIKPESIQDFENVKQSEPEPAQNTIDPLSMLLENGKRHTKQSKIKPQFCSYYGYGNKNFNKKTFNVKSGNGVYESAKLQSDPKTVLAKKCTTRRVKSAVVDNNKRNGIRKGIVDYEADKWKTTNMLAFKMPKKKVDAKVLTC